MPTISQSPPGAVRATASVRTPRCASMSTVASTARATSAAPARALFSSFSSTCGAPLVTCARRTQVWHTSRMPPNGRGRCEWRTLRQRCTGAARCCSRRDGARARASG